MHNLKSDLYFSGISGLQLPIPKSLYPPPFENVSRLTYYSSIFNSIEFNSSFYKVPQLSTVTKWASSVTKNFKFTFKLWKEITHSKGFKFKDEDVLKFLGSVNSVKEKNACLLIQFPPSMGYEAIEQLDKLLSSIQVLDEIDWRIAVEFRNKSWYNNSTYKLLNIYRAALVIQDIPRSATPLISHESDFMYIRFHGPTGNYRESYSEEFLHEYAIYIDEYLIAGKEVFVYFNNTMGDAFNNLKTLNSLVQQRINMTYT